MDADAVYQQAVRKLRILLTASEVASSMDEDDQLSLSMGESPGVVGLTDPSTKRRFKKNRQGSASARRALNFGSKIKPKHNSWHNLLQIDNEVETDVDNKEELLLIRRQEDYIKQLEKETLFCRRELSSVLQNVKRVLQEKEATRASEEVSNAISNVFSTIQGWQNNINPTPEAIEATEAINKLRVENAKLARQLQEERVSEESPHVVKLRNDIAILTEALQKGREETEVIRVREEEAVEQVKRSIQAAEQLKMEKSELEYELGQIKMQMERQQARIRGLMEDQVNKLEEERDVVERKANDKLKMVQDEHSKQLEESARLSTLVDQLQRSESELRCQIQDRDQLMANVKKETEKRLGQMQTELVRVNAAKEDLQQRCGLAEGEADQAKQEAKSEISRITAEVKALRGRLSRAEEALLKSRQEALELTEEKATVERELTLIRRVEVGGTSLASAPHHTDPKAVNVAKLEDMVRRQSRIISELRYQCGMVTDKLEETARALEEEKRSVTAKVASLEDTASRASRRALEAESRLEERMGVQHGLSGRLQQADLELRQVRLMHEELKQEKALVEQETHFLRGLLKSRGLIPEKDQQDLKLLPSPAVVKTIGLSDKVPRKAKSRPQAIVVQRKGKIL